VVCTAHARADASEHNNFNFFACHERVSENHGQLALPERNVCSLLGLSLLRIKGSHTLFQSKERLINLSPFDLPILIVTLALLSSFTSSQVNQEKFTALFYSLLLDLNLCNCVASAGSVVGLCGVSSPHLVSLPNQFENLVIIVNELLFEPGNLDSIILVFSQIELLVLVQKIVKFASINFIHRDCNSEVPLMIFPVVNPSLEQIFNGYALQTVHSVSFT
jgi:hypothetical protein